MPTGHTESVDGAAMLVAYRDKLDLTGQRGIYGVDGMQTDIANFEDAAVGDDFTRSAATGIAGLRNTPGFRSIGEILCARYQPGNDPNARFGLDHSIDRLGFDSLTSGFGGTRIDAIGIDSVTYDDAGGQPQVDGSEFDYDEKLGIANAVLNSINVRSDTFCVWFVVHGYREADVMDLEMEDPMVPSIARRFMMIVDRSNVDERTDEPRILLFREVPL